jgi:hypothetical protein
MIDKSGNVKLLDFGLACLIDRTHPEGTRQDETTPDRLIGTLDYMSPEQADGIRLQASADLYGLGATLFYLLTGRPPHATGHNRTLLAQLKALSCEDPPRLADLRPNVPQGLSNLVEKLLARNPAGRPERAADVADRLATWADPDAKTALVNLIPAVDRTDDAEAAARSLAELVGSQPRGAASEPQNHGHKTANGGRRPIGRWMLVLAGFVATIGSIVLLVQTSDGMGANPAIIGHYRLRSTQDTRNRRECRVTYDELRDSYWFSHRFNGGETDAFGKYIGGQIESFEYKLKDGALQPIDGGPAVRWEPGPNVNYIVWIESLDENRIFPVRWWSVNEEWNDW